MNHLDEITMHAKYIMFILLLFCACGIVHGVQGVQGETGHEQELIKSAEIAKESLQEALSEMMNAFDATMKALNATLDAFIDICKTVNHGFALAHARLGPVLERIGENVRGNDNTIGIE